MQSLQNEVISRLGTGRSINVYVSFLLLGRGGWGRIYYGRVTFFLLCWRIGHSCFLLFASR